jgi:thioesterase domain-containing protein/acyl carrier protein
MSTTPFTSQSDPITTTVDDATLEIAIGAIVAEVLGIEEVGIQDDFFELGGDSLQVIQVLGRIYESLGINLVVAAFSAESTTVASLARQVSAVLRQRMVVDPITARPDEQKPPLFSLAAPAVLATKLFDAPFYSVGDGDNDLRHYQSIEAIAAVYVRHVRTLQKEGPYRLSGFSFFGLIALEVAQLLHKQGHEVSLLVMIDPPDKCLSPRLRYYPARIRHHLSRLAKLHPKSWLKYCLARASVMSWRTFARFMEVANQPEKVDIAFLREKLQRAYMPEIYPGRVTLFVARERVENVENSAKGPDFGWGTVAGGGIDVHVIPGEHSTLFLEPNIGSLAKQLDDVLSRYQS